MIFLGFDTSNYTTSVAAADENNGYINIRKLLDVGQGERGLRQSNALFQHIKTIGELFCELGEKTDMKDAAAVGISTRPRNVEGSYMPVFLAGKVCGETAASALGVPLYEFSHQDGHIMAGIYSSNAFELLEKPFISVHLSGGTCEIIYTKYNGRDFDLTIAGGTKDISAGQLIDRVGVKMGFGFPAGGELDKISRGEENPIKLPVNVSKGYINFSGIETKALSLVGKEDNKRIASGVFYGVAGALSKALSYAAEEYEAEKILIVGGVAANETVKKVLFDKFGKKIYFASEELSGDNAVGTALLAKNFYYETRKKRK